MYAASQFLTHKWAGLKPKDSATCVPLSYIDCALIDQYLSEDGARVAYSALVSIGDALRGIESGFYSWSIVKLYYSVFYSLRALLAFGNIAVFYIGASPFWVVIRPGERPHPGNSSSSHKLILDLFKQEYKSSPLLSQYIGFEDPLTWLQNQREHINYKQARFSEPNVPLLFSIINKNKSLRTLISTYMLDNLYAFDPDHAILAYPIAVLKELRNNRGSSQLFNDDEQSDLQSILGDSLGPMASFDTIIKA